MTFDFGNAPPSVDINNLEAEITRWRNAAFAASNRAEAALAALRDSEKQLAELNQVCQWLKQERDELAKMVPPREPA